MSDTAVLQPTEHLALASKKQSFAHTSKGEKATVMARNNPPSWGLKIPGRPPTPSEGYAQEYDRIGPVETQRLWTFDNGTCLRYGPDDLVDEFDPEKHPFSNQVALVDTMIRDIVTVRARYEVSRPQQDDAHSDNTVFEEDPFNNFRQRAIDPSQVTQVTVGSAVYNQVPSRFATIGTLISVYTLPNKSDVPGECHRGLSNDTRFGMSGKPSIGAQQIREKQQAQRQDNIHRSAMQRLMHVNNQQASGRGRRGRGGRPIEQPQARNYASRNGENVPNAPGRGFSGRGQGFRRGRGTFRGGKRNDAVHGHQRFKSQAYSVAATPLPNFSFPAASETNFTLDDYEDEGPLPETPYKSDWARQAFDQATDDGTSYDDDQVTQIGFDGHHSHGEDLASFRAVQESMARQGFANAVLAHDHAYPATRPQFQPDVIDMPHIEGHSSGALPDLLSPLSSFGSVDFHEYMGGDGTGGFAGDRAMNENVGGLNIADGAIMMLEHHKMLSNGGAWSTSLQNNGHISRMQADRRAVLEDRFVRKPVPSLTTRRIRPSQIGRESFTRPSSPLVVEDGRLSAPPHNRLPPSFFPPGYSDARMALGDE